MPANPKYQSVQCLRALAALSVMFFHYRYLINNQFPATGDALFGWGAYGVDLFFILSGFVICLSAERMGTGLSSGFTFMKKRAIRILPTSYILLLLTFLLTGAMSNLHYPEKMASFNSAMTFSPYYADHAPFYIDDGGAYGIRWTLNYEIYFYIIFSACLLLKKPVLTLTAFFVSAMVILPLLAGQQATLSADGYAFHSARLNLLTNPVSWLFIAGVFIAKARYRVVHLPFVLRLLSLIVALAFVAFCFADLLFTGHGISGSGFPLLLLFIAVIANHDWLDAYAPRWLAFIGDISFSLYLLHTLLITGLGKHLRWTGLTNGVAGFILYSVIAIVLASLAFRFIEKPFLSREKRLLPAQ
ncbi:acyltransferase [Pantoea sp.]|uniref:acyltransferase family protein n=1 Tax=Pantoea sp. TaxID=69393 RepID=UPI0028A1027C|nr:acyltransferase [Pantoea sp.]